MSHRGWVAISVMSFDYTNSIAKYIVRNSDIQEQLSSLPVSTIMQDSGEVFNPDYFLLDVRSEFVTGAKGSTRIMTCHFIWTCVTGGMAGTRSQSYAGRLGWRWSCAAMSAPASSNWRAMPGTS